MQRQLLVLSDGTEIYSGPNEAVSIRSCTYTESVNDGTELTPGSAVAAMLEVSIIDKTGALTIGQGSELTYYRVDPDGTRHRVGLFTCEKPTRSSAYILKLTAYDRVSWLDQDLTSWLQGLDGWPYTVLDFANMVCQQCGLSLDNTSLINGEYEIQQFSADGITGRTLMQWLGQICCRFCRATSDGRIIFSWYQDRGLHIQPNGETYYFGGSLSYEEYQVASIDKVQLRQTDEDVGVIFPEDESGTNAYVIQGNRLLTASSDEALRPVAGEIYAAISGIRYTPCSVSVRDDTDVSAGDIVTVTDANGKTFSAYVMTRKVSAQKAALEATGSPSRTSVEAVNEFTARYMKGKLLEVSASIDGLKIKSTAILEKTEQIDTDLDDVRQSVEEASADAAAQLAQLEQELSAELGVTAEGIYAQLSKTTTDLSDTDARISKIEKRVDLSADTAITISSDGIDGITLELDNDKGIIFKRNGSQFGLWDGENFYTGNIVIRLSERLQFGGFAYIPRSNGNTSLLYVGGA